MSLAECADCGATPVLTLNSVVLWTPAWMVLDPWPLVFGRDYRTGDYTVFGTPGRRSTTQRHDLTVYELELAVTGEVDPAGNPTPYEDVPEQYLWNLWHLRGNVSNPAVAGSDGMIPAVLDLPDGSSSAFRVRVRPFKLQRVEDHVVMPDGRARTASILSLTLESNDAIIE